MVFVIKVSKYVRADFNLQGMNPKAQRISATCIKPLCSTTAIYVILQMLLIWCFVGFQLKARYDLCSYTIFAQCFVMISSVYRL